jgi:hypothetical protein
MAMEAVGIVDFATRRAIARGHASDTGGLGRPIPSSFAVYMFCEGPAMCGALPGGWTELFPPWPASLPRKPLELRFLDLLRADSLVQEQALGEEEVRGVPTSRFGLTLKFDRTDWPKPDRGASAARDNSLLSRLSVKTLPDPRPHGVVLAEVWIDEEGRLRRFSWTETPSGRRRPAVLHWQTTQLWDFGGPPAIADRNSQQVIDPTTMQPITVGPPEIES